MAAVRRREQLSDARLARGDSYLFRRNVLSAGGKVVADHHTAWLADEMERDAGHAPTTKARLRELGYQLTECAIDTLLMRCERLRRPRHQPLAVRESHWMQAVCSWRL
jgi:hypothetical protein